MGQSGATTAKRFAVPTLGLKDVFFAWGTAKAAAKFEETVSALARHVGTQPWKHSSLASKAMSSLSEPVIAEPDRPVREYWTDGTQTAKTNNAVSDDTPPVPLVPVKEDWDHDIDVDDYKSKRKSFRERKEAWEENRAKCYYLVLSHCPKELETELRNSSKWAAAEEEQDVIALLLMVRDITHNKKERKESVMTIVESDVELYTTVQEKREVWDGNRAKCYCLVLSHCPKELETELRNSSNWTAVEKDQVVALGLILVPGLLRFLVDLPIGLVVVHVDAVVPVLLDRL